jgi:hypothetical protein
MKPLPETPVPAPGQMDSSNVPGLPWFRTWRGVYLFVFGCFVLWVLLLLALTVSFS